jgi:2-hydroxycyclohexanecarboxyl-CoA dehydrogenase
VEFDGKVALVTGGASGIGFATASALAQGGATVYIGDIDAQNGRAAAERVSRDGNAVFLRLDVTDEQSVANAKAAVTDKHGALDILVNAAGWSKVERFVDTTPDLWRRLIDPTIWARSG